MMDEGWLTLVRIARDSGDISSLFPPGITSLADAPYTFVECVRMALYFLSFENLLEKERPPRAIWLNNEAMEEWWREVKANREAETGAPGSYESMQENAALKELFTGGRFRG